jgi:hypothetical protein
VADINRNARPTSSESALPRKVWGLSIQGTIDYLGQLPVEGNEAFVDDMDYPTLGTAKEPVDLKQVQCTE